MKGYCNRAIFLDVVELLFSILKTDYADALLIFSRPKIDFANVLLIFGCPKTDNADALFKNGQPKNDFTNVLLLSSVPDKAPGAIRKPFFINKNDVLM